MQTGKKKRGVRVEDIAALAGVSAATVSRALNDSPLVKDDTKRHIWALAKENQYSFRPQMPTALSGAEATIIVAIPAPVGRTGGPADPFFMELIGGIGEAAREAGCDIIISHVTPRSYEDAAAIVETSRAEGVIFLGQSFLHDRFNQMADRYNRFVVWGAELPGQKYCSVGSMNLRGGERAVSHLIRLGRKRIAFFGETEAPEILQRFEGYKKALKQAGLPVDNDLIASAHFGVESAEDAVRRLLARGVKFDAIFGASDLIALGSIRALTKAGLSVPGDAAVVGYDNILLARYSSPALTTISQDMALAGRVMVTKLLDKSHGDSLLSEQLPTDLIVRETCGA